MTMTKSSTPPQAIRLSITPEVGLALHQAKKLYPTLSDPEILKLGLSKIVTDDRQTFTAERNEIDRQAAYSVGHDYLRDPEENAYTADMGTKVSF